MNLPPRHDGPHWCLGALVAVDAHTMLSCAPYLGAAQKHVPVEVSLSHLEDGIWRWLQNGWTRIRDDGVLVHWHPQAEDWVPWSRSLHDTYTAEFADMRHWLTHVQEQSR